MVSSYICFLVRIPSMSVQVGGDFFEGVLARMNQFGRVCICGAISGYNALEPPNKFACIHE